MRPALEVALRIHWMLSLAGLAAVETGVAEHVVWLWVFSMAAVAVLWLAHTWDRLEQRRRARRMSEQWLAELNEANWGRPLVLPHLPPLPPLPVAPLDDLSTRWGGR